MQQQAMERVELAEPREEGPAQILPATRAWQQD